MIEKIKNYILHDCSDEEAKKTSLLFSFIFIVLSHTVIYVTPLYGHDNIVIAMDRVHQSATGTRWLQDWFLEMVGFVNSTWFNGLICIALLIIITVQIIDVFDVRKRIFIILSAGLIITNPTIINSNLYGWPFLFFFACSFMTSAAWIMLKMNGKVSKIAIYGMAILLICFGCATYGGYIAVFPTLLSLKILLDILTGKEFKENISNTVKGVVLFIAGVALYYAIERVSLKILGVASIEEYGTRNSVTHFIGVQKYLYGVERAYFDFVNYLIGRTDRFGYVPSILSLACVAVACFSLVYIVYKNRNGISKANLFFVLFIIVLEPMLVNLIYVAAAGFAHALMFFSFVLVYVFAIKISEIALSNYCTNGVTKKVLFSASVIITTLLVYYGIFLSNVAYTRAENCYTRTVSICTRLLDRIEMNYTGSEDVILIGTIDMHSNYFKSEESDSLSMLYGMTYVDPMYNNSFAFGGKEITYLTQIMGSGLEYHSFDNKKNTVSQLEGLNSIEKEKIEKMSVFPMENSVINIGNHVIVCLSE